MAFGKGRFIHWSRISLMNGTLQDLVRKELCPDGVWRLTDVMKSLLRYQISQLPKAKVTEDETRYPQSVAGMRAFLVKFFARHYLHTQNSLVDYMTSQDFVEVIRSGKLRILDVGSGPAVACLAITDMIACILEHLKGIVGLVKGLSNLEKLCSNDGRILILQDTFQSTLMRRISRAMGISSREKESTQEVYPKRNTNESYTYSYYYCLYRPRQKTFDRQSSVA